MSWRRSSHVIDQHAGGLASDRDGGYGGYGGACTLASGVLVKEDKLRFVPQPNTAV